MSADEKSTQWISDLNGDSAVSVKTVQEIYCEARKKKSDIYSDSLRDALVSVIKNHAILPKFTLQITCSAFFQLLTTSGKDDFSLDGFNFQDTRLAVNLIDGMLSTDYRKAVDTEKIAKKVLEVVNICSKDQSIFILWALKNLLNFCKYFPDFKYDFDVLLMTVWMNLTSNIAGVREQTLSLMEFITKKCPERSKYIFQEILNRWSWTNPHKYYLLGVIAANVNTIFHDFEEKEKHLFLEGLSSSLRHRNLLSPGQYLFKSLVKHKQVNISEMMRNILLERSPLEADNFINQWLSSYKDLDCLLDDLSLEYEEMDTCRYILVRRAFNEQLASQNIQLDQDLMEKVDLSSLESILRQHLYEILIHRLTKGIDMTVNLQFLERFLTFHIADNNTGLRNYIFKRLSGILVQLARKERRESPETIKFFIFLKREVVDCGLKSDPEEYQPIIFALRMMDLLMRFLSGRYSLTKNHSGEGNERIRETLERSNVFKFSSDEDFKRILPQLRSNFDDVQELTCQIICEFFQGEEVKVDVQRLFREALLSENSIESASSCHLYARILSETSEEVLTDHVDSLKESFKVFQEDPFASVQSGQHIFHKIASLVEIVKCSRSTKDHPMQILMNLTLEITEKILNFLNHTGEFEEAPSFEVMEESLQVLIDRSRLEATQPHAEARKLLLLSLWMTLKACGELATASAQNQQELAIAMKVNTSILQRCRHKGAIEAAGLSLGSLVRRIDPENPILTASLESLFEERKKLSTTRRAAGYSIMFLNLLRNDRSEDKKLLQRSMKIIFASLQRKNSMIAENCDNMEAVMLHYLCILVKDSSLFESMIPFIPRILSIAFQKIDSDEWTVRNGALQLCGALIPKIVGQKTHFQEEEEWQPVKLSLDDLRTRFSDISDFLLATLIDFNRHSTTKLITILELLSRIEFWWTEIQSEDNVTAFRKTLWTLLSHPCHKIRLLAAKCFSGCHEFHQIPRIVLGIVEILPEICDLNAFHGLILACDALTRKYKADSFAMPRHKPQDFLLNLHEAIDRRWIDFPDRKISSFTRIYLKKYLIYVENDLAIKIQADLGS
ncbi:uncharacterized protein LOC132257953 [Phlebotomus argentipes]|uniref:uncharacterized protein LOC132257953 n=1 Tax=Phlebotomus argentipes TaxID=94469 RepID=UPI002892998F|nr:uncharacterized protein LOC132257953 [Phlebotomus argentipes]